jgi:hypothetical protein
MSVGAAICTKEKRTVDGGECHEDFGGSFGATETSYALARHTSVSLRSGTGLR